MPLPSPLPGPQPAQRVVVPSRELRIVQEGRTMPRAQLLELVRPGEFIKQLEELERCKLVLGDATFDKTEGTLWGGYAISRPGQSLRMGSYSFQILCSTALLRYIGEHPLGIRGNPVLLEYEIDRNGNGTRKDAWQDIIFPGFA